MGFHPEAGPNDSLEAKLCQKVASNRAAMKFWRGAF